nr:MAG TPA: hypothetical protein [Caudoviricetes sp.]
MTFKSFYRMIRDYYILCFFYMQVFNRKYHNFIVSNF